MTIHGARLLALVEKIERWKVDEAHRYSYAIDLLLHIQAELAAVADAADYPWDGCSGKGRPTCTATECMYGLDQYLKPKARTCAFVDQGSVASGEAPRCPTRTDIFGRCALVEGHAGRHENSLSEDFSVVADDPPDVEAQLLALDAHLGTLRVERDRLEAELTRLAGLRSQESEP